MALQTLSLCSGVGLLDLALAPWCRTVGYVEREAFCQNVLLDRMETADLDRAPLFSDLARFDGRAFRGAVDGVVSGLPCQPYSVAGKQRGNSDERALFPHLVRIVRECEPAWVFFENVPAFLDHSEPLWGELRALGFGWGPPLFTTAAESGAPHDRERLFLVAVRGAPPPQVYPNANGARLWRERCGWVLDRERETWRHDPDGCSVWCRVKGTNWEAESPPLRVAHGYPAWVDELRAIGNGVCIPQAREAFRLLMGLDQPKGVK